MKGADIDIVSLKPDEIDRREKGLAEEREQGRRDEEHAGFLKSLDSPGGKALLDAIESQLADRIDELVKTDPAAQAYIKLSTDLGGKIVLGRRAASRIMDRCLKKG